MTLRLLPYGPAAWLVELDERDVLAVAAAIAELDDVAEVVPAARTVLVQLTPGADREQVAATLRELAERPGRRADHRRRERPSRSRSIYDGEDLDAVADACGLTVAEVVERHAAATYRCAFCGFAPGFAYLTGLDPALELPRRATPRTRVPAGSVAIAAAYSAVYPTASPGGWHLLGRTAAVLFDTTRDPPALITPGTTVRFRAAAS